MARRCQNELGWKCPRVPWLLERLVDARQGGGGPTSLPRSTGGAKQARRGWRAGEARRPPDGRDGRRPNGRPRRRQRLTGAWVAFYGYRTVATVRQAAEGAAVAGALVLIATVASAQDAAPKIDGAKYCDAVSGMLNSSTAARTIIRDGCLKNEADYAAKLTHVWAKVPEADRDSCQKLLALAQPSNQGLAGCLGLAMAKHFLDDDMLGCK